MWVWTRPNPPSQANRQVVGKWASGLRAGQQEHPLTPRVGGVQQLDWPQEGRKLISTPLQRRIRCSGTPANGPGRLEALANHDASSVPLSDFSQAYSAHLLLNLRAYAASNQSTALCSLVQDARQGCDFVQWWICRSLFRFLLYKYLPDLGKHEEGLHGGGPPPRFWGPGHKAYLLCSQQQLGVHFRTHNSSVVTRSFCGGRPSRAAQSKQTCLQRSSALPPAGFPGKPSLPTANPRCYS